MKKYLIPIYITLFMIGVVALWYFGHHRPVQKILQAEPQTVYKSTSRQPSDLSVKPIPSDSTQVLPDEDTDTEGESIDNASTPENMDNNQEWGAGADKLVLQEDPLVDDPAAEAYEKYASAELEYQAAQETLKKVFPFKNTDPAMSAAKEAKEAISKSDYQVGIEKLTTVLTAFENMDTAQIESAVEAYKEAKLRRNEALENLAVYSEDAAEMLAELKEVERQENEARVQSDRRLRELRTEFRNIQDQVEKLEKLEKSQ